MHTRAGRPVATLGGDRFARPCFAQGASLAARLPHMVRRLRVGTLRSEVLTSRAEIRGILTIADGYHPESLV